MNNNLKLYVWEEVNQDLTYGVMFALAYNIEQAKQLIRDGYEVFEEDDLEKEPNVYQKPFGLSIYGGG